MDESWRMRMGMPTLPIRRRSMEDTTTPGTTRRSMDALRPDDFSDVFGGPPRSVLSRKFSGDFTATRSSSSSFYEEVFRPPEFVSTVIDKKNKNSGGGCGRSLPAFRIPAKGEGFYSDVFGWEEGRRSRERSRPNSKAKSNSKSNSSSVLSSEELSPHRRPVSGDDAALSSFASKLRPINVPCRWNSNTMRPEEEYTRKQEIPSFPSNSPSYADNYYMENNNNNNNDNFRSAYIKVSRQVSSPETISIEPSSFRSIKVSVDDLELNSPSSPVSSLCQEPEASICNPRNTMQEEEEEEMEHDEDEVMSSYVIEINSDHREVASEAISIDEAIAWAKEKFQSQSFDTEQKQDHSTELQETHEFLQPQLDRLGRTQSPTEEELKKWRSEEETEQSGKDMEMELLDEDIRLWSAGKETNIRLLLSTLHHILWPNSGWYAIPLTNLIESSHVKKAYQKARLCLHPDKLQQRGATLPQKYVAEKAFSILQDAWAAFISQDVLFS